MTGARFIIFSVTQSVTFDFTLRLKVVVYNFDIEMEMVQQFLQLYRMGVVSWEDVEIVMEGYYRAMGQRRMPVPRRMLHGTFEVGNWTDEEVVSNLRFEREHLPLLQECLQIPDDVLIADRRYRVPGMTALCILLRRLSYPNRYCDLERTFGMSPSALSSIVNAVISHILERKGHLLIDLASHAWLAAEKLAYYAAAVARRGAPLTNCWGFIDGTTRHICRPTIGQENFYSGHKRYHCIKFQSTVTPDGLIINLLGSFEGRRHDAGIYRDSRYSDQLRRLCSDDHPYVLYGDAAYPISGYLIKPYPTATQEVHEIQFNRSMSTCRQAVEWMFGKVVREFAFVDFHKNLKLLKQDVSGLYKVAVILTNCHSCLYGSQVADFFQCTPPSLQDYLQN